MSAALGPVVADISAVCTNYKPPLMWPSARKIDFWPAELLSGPISRLLSFAGLRIPEEPDTSWRGRRVVITGPTAGLTLAVAEAFASRGACITLAVRDQEKATKMVEEMQTRHPHATVVPRALDLGSPCSIEHFADDFHARDAGIHVLINIPDVESHHFGLTDQEDRVKAQVHYQGVYTLVRKLERRLLAFQARVVNVSCFTHRLTRLDPTSFVHETGKDEYSQAMLANVMFTYELQRRLGPAGLRAVAVDTGSLCPAEWYPTICSLPLLKQLINYLGSPPKAAAATIVHAATMPWDQERDQLLKLQDDLRYYARGVYSWRLLSWMVSSGGSFRHKLVNLLVALASSMFIDWPMRHLPLLSWVANRTSPVPSAKETYDCTTGAILWDESAKQASVSDQAQALDATELGGIFTEHDLPRPVPSLFYMDQSDFDEFKLVLIGHRVGTQDVSQEYLDSVGFSSWKERQMYKRLAYWDWDGADEDWPLDA